tara:strand:+ start:157 stop:1110 length:954 start_codon:yes stop_codon:yes gene_type:complete
MPKITIPYAATTGDDLTPTEEVNQSIFSAAPAVGDQNSGAVLNGSLQQDNLDMIVTYEEFKKGAHSQGGSIGTTDNVDYFPDLFPAGEFVYDPSGNSSESLPSYNFVTQTDFFQPLPGLNQTFHNPYKKALVIFTWSMTLAVDGWSEKPSQLSYNTQMDKNKHGAWVVFKMTKPDGTEVTRGVNGTETAFRSVLPKADTPASGARRGAQNDLYFSGHLTLELDGQGWHTAGLHLGFAGPEQKTSLAFNMASDPVWGTVDNPLWIYALRDAEMGSGTQTPEDYQPIPAGIEETFTVWGEGIRQARVRVRSIRHVLFRL